MLTILTVDEGWLEGSYFGHSAHFVGEIEFRLILGGNRGWGDLKCGGGGIEPLL
jgi:hypothetical protein